MTHKQKQIFRILSLLFNHLFLEISCTLIGSTDNQQLSFGIDSRNVEETQTDDSHRILRNDHDTSNLIFASYLALLQQWPNSFAFSGHSIVTGTIPPNTLLYHGLNSDARPPEGVEWLAFDSEMSFGIHSIRFGNSKLLTYVSERPLRIIYIDGQSASLGTPGFMDSQSVLIDGRVDEKWEEGFSMIDEYKRAKDLCAIGENWGFEGVVRMNSGFELIWCNFKKGIKLVGQINSTDPFMEPSELIPGPRGPKFFHRPTSPFYLESMLMWGQSAILHNFVPGEARVRLDPSGFVSFYDRIDSLAEKRRKDGTENSGRSSHRLYGISGEDVEKIRQRLIKALKRKNEGKFTDQVDWTTIALTISQRYGSRLEDLSELLNRNALNATMIALEVRKITYAMMMPYVDFSQYDDKDFRWLEPSISKCSTAYTYNQFAMDDDEDSTESIQTIKNAIEGTLLRICRTTTEVFSETLAIKLPLSHVNFDPIVERIAQDRLSGWRAKVDGLIHWLGWYLRRCEPKCSAEESCLPPLWPILGFGKRLNETYISKFPRCLNLKSRTEFF
ncbi:hypothetical protein BY996DRAFT_4592901 [Phakopsora pachyrhizi]|uniref:Uncharacterized protein n=1 Tax=Phakopsora pachyrhizi TaxID=170000 RepID=A0AAV0B7V2_PHAPC|nr:hypothetical protein BY996DRAFT_4592901 [Phakopsora pachyrhizi]CAH7682529.1 hypothetical protein PPACK8108_LOCUS15479 [Phakopsora pachyrhizi]